MRWYPSSISLRTLKIILQLLSMEISLYWYGMRHLGGVLVHLLFCMGRSKPIIIVAYCQIIPILLSILYSLETGDFSKYQHLSSHS
ncbi:hypothetical protein X975_10587, partial [Stegodyphus mimosarum]